MNAIKVYEKLIESLEQQNKTTEAIIERFNNLEKRIEALEAENEKRT